MVFHTLHRFQRDTRLCTLIIYRSLCCTLTFAPPQDSYFTSLSHLSPPLPSALSLPLTTIPPDKITHSHNCIPTYSPWALSDPSCRSNIDCISMYCTNMFYRRLIYSSIDKNLASPLAEAAEVYLHLLSDVLSGSCHASRLATWVWKYLGRCPCRRRTPRSELWRAVPPGPRP